MSFILLYQHFLQVITKVTVSDVLPSTKAAFSFKIPDNKSGKVSSCWFRLNFEKKKRKKNILPSTKAAFSFKTPDNKYGKVSCCSLQLNFEKNNKKSKIGRIMIVLGWNYCSYKRSDLFIVFNFNFCLRSTKESFQKALERQVV